MATTDDAAKSTESALDPNWTDSIKDAFKNSQEADGTSDDDANDDDDGTNNDDDDSGAEADKGTDAGDEGNDDDNNGGDDDDDDKGTDDSKSDSKSDFRYTQFKGDGKPETYLKNLEEGYANFYGEIQRIKGESETAVADAENFKAQVEAIKTAVASDPEFGKKVIELLDGASADAKKNGGAEDSTKSDNPFVRDAQTKWQQENDKSAADFAQENPEVLSDPILAEKVTKLVTRFGKEIYADEHRLPLAGELMEKAYGYLGLTAKKAEKQELADAMKKESSPIRKQASKKKSVSSKQFSNLTLDISKNMGISKDRLEKNAK